MDVHNYLMYDTNIIVPQHLADDSKTNFALKGPYTVMFCCDNILYAIQPTNAALSSLDLRRHFCSTTKYII